MHIYHYAYQKAHLNAAMIAKQIGLRQEQAGCDLVKDWLHFIQKSRSWLLFSNGNYEDSILYLNYYSHPPASAHTHSEDWAST